MRSVFIGTVDEGWQILNALLKCEDHRKDLVGIITLKDVNTKKISGYCTFDDLAKEYKIPLYKVSHIRSKKSLHLIRDLRPDLIMVFGFSQLISKEVLQIPRYGCIGLHTTLLPKHRGRAPIPWSIIKGLGRSGNTLFRLTPRVDDGEIIGQEAFYITLDDTASSIYEKATQAGIDLVLKYLPMITKGEMPLQEQVLDNVDFWPRRRPEDGVINWRASAREVHDFIRAQSAPYPGAFTHHRNKKIILWRSKLVGSGELGLDIEPGKILDITKYDQALVVGTGDGIVLVDKLQPEGKKIMTGYQYAFEYDVKIGEGFHYEYFSHCCTS